MTSLISARRAADEFARVVDGAQPDVADRHADLLATVDLLRRQDTPTARPEFVADLRAQLMTAADTLLVSADPEPATVVPLRPERHRRRIAVAAAAFVVVGGTAGVAAAAENSLPGDPLYGLKRSIESARVSLNTSDAARGHDLVKQASTRLDEVGSLVDSGDASRISHTLGSFKRSEADGADLLFVSYQRGGNPDDLASLRTTLLEQMARLDALAAQAPRASRPDFASAKALLGDLDQQARVLCANCGPDAGASSFADFSSSPALEGLITQSARDASAARQQAITRALAAKAAEIAAKTPKAPAPGSGSGAVTTATGSGSVLPGVSVPVPVPTTTQENPLKGTVTTVTGSVQGLLGSVDDTTGGLLSPVTDTVNNTLDAVTGILVGP